MLVGGGAVTYVELVAGLAGCLWSLVFLTNGKVNTKSNLWLLSGVFSLTPASARCVTAQVLDSYKIRCCSKDSVSSGLTENRRSTRSMVRMSMRRHKQAQAALGAKSSICARARARAALAPAQEDRCTAGGADGRQRGRRRRVC